MALVLIFLATCLFGVTLAAISFSIPMQTGEEEATAEVPVRAATPDARFFLPESAVVAVDPDSPLQAMLSRLEDHVRKEHAAAEEFLRGPSPESLHAPNQTSLWN
jgi:hypothetical protein